MVRHMRANAVSCAHRLLPFRSSFHHNTRLAGSSLGCKLFEQRDLNGILHSSKTVLYTYYLSRLVIVAFQEHGRSHSAIGARRQESKAFLLHLQTTGRGRHQSRPGGSKWMSN